MTHWLEKYRITISYFSRGDGTKHYEREAYLNDGVKQTKYEVVKKELLPLMTLVTVNLCK